MCWTLRVLVVSAAVGLAGLFTAEAQEKKTDKATPKGAIAGKVKSVDAEKNTLTITTEDGKTVSTFSPVVLRQMISAETAAQIGDALRGVVSDRGTAAAAAVPGFTISG